MASDISEQLRAEIARRAEYRCEYCFTHEDNAGFPHQSDHVVSRKHGGSSDFNNLADAVRLFDPRRDRWAIISVSMTQQFFLRWPPI